MQTLSINYLVIIIFHPKRTFRTDLSHKSDVTKSILVVYVTLSQVLTNIVCYSIHTDNLYLVYILYILSSKLVGYSKHTFLTQIPMETEASQPEEGSKAAPAARTKKPTMEVYVPKKRQTEKTDPKEKPQTGDDKKSRPRPRYTDKARKNKKDKAKAAETPNGEVKRDEGGPEVGDKENLNKQDESRDDIDRTMNVPDTSSALEHEEMPEEDEEEEEDEGENWDSLFNDDGDCVEPNLMEEVRVTKMIQLC